jgi:hypothetical protein
VRGRLTVVVSSWSDGVAILGHGEMRRAFGGQLACGLESDGAGGAYALIGGDAVHAWSPDGRWRELASGDGPLRCCVKLGERLLVGTDDARVLELSRGAMTPLTGFETTPGRESWYAGAALIDGRMIGPPLGVRSIAATCDGGVLLANVHVGGVPRSMDGGSSWRPTIDIDADVHQVSTHPSRPEIVVAAAAAGLCVSRDGGESWSVTTDGLHASYCSAAALSEDWLYLAASSDHFADQGAVYRQRIDADGPLERVRGGLPEWLAGIADTYCIATRDECVAIVDHGGNLYGSIDAGATWAVWAQGLTAPSGVLVC